MSLHGPVSRPPKSLERNILEFAELAFPGGGFFVEAGGHDGLKYSNTLALDATKWSGLMIEPSPVSFPLLRKNRPEVLAANVALVGSPDIKFIHGTFHSGSPLASAHPGLMSRDSRAFAGQGIFRRIVQKFAKILRLSVPVPLTQVPATTLTQLLADMKVSAIDLFILDVEGLELSVLEGFTFSLKPRVFVIETRTADAMKISNIMLKNGFVLAANFSNFDPESHPNWSGDHQDFVWIRNSEDQLLSDARNLKLFQ